MSEKITIITNFNVGNLFHYDDIEKVVKNYNLSWMIQYTIYKEKDSEDVSDGNVGLIGLLYSIAETGVFGTIEQTDNQNIWDIMVRVYQVVMQGRATEEKMKKHGTSS